jgi:hypothetical protein
MNCRETIEGVKILRLGLEHRLIMHGGFAQPPRTPEALSIL